MLWSASCGVELLILYHINADNDSGALRYWEHREILTNILRLFLLALIAIRLLYWDIDNISGTPQMTSLFAGDLEANYGINARLPRLGDRFPRLRTFAHFLLHILPKSTILQLSFPVRILLAILQHIINRFPWLSTFRRFLLHVWPKSTILQLSFLSRVLLVILQRVVNILLPYQFVIFTECLF